MVIISEIHSYYATIHIKIKKHARNIQLIWLIRDQIESTVLLKDFVLITGVVDGAAGTIRQLNVQLRAPSRQRKRTKKFHPERRKGTAWL